MMLEGAASIPLNGKVSLDIRRARTLLDHSRARAHRAKEGWRKVNAARAPALVDAEECELLSRGDSCYVVAWRQGARSSRSKRSQLMVS